MGWKYESVVSTLEAKRKVKSAEFYAAKKSKARAEKKAEEAAGEGMEVVKSTLRGLGY
jgi:large subunit ribosomal protein L13Ae